MRVVIAGGTGVLGQRLADHLRDQGDDITLLTRSPRDTISHRQLRWDGKTVGPWATELSGAVLINLAGELVDLPPTKKNVERLRRSRVDSTRALVHAVASLDAPPALWLQMSTLAIYGDAGQGVVAEGHPVASGPPQMPGVAVPWEAALDGARADRVVIMRTGIVLDHGTPAFDRLTKLTKLGLGGRISRGDQWTSWLHVTDFLRAVDFLCQTTLDGTVHVTAPSPIQNRDMMATLRGALRRPWSPPTPRPLVHAGAFFMRSDPALALTGRRCVPQRLLDAGFDFKFPTFGEAISDLVGD
jgi:uncharacterized protein (TIGR01777 family)